MWRFRRTIKNEISIWRIAAIPGIALILIVIILRLSGSIQVLEWIFLDTFLRMRPSEPIDEEVVIIGINEEDIRKIGRYPIPDGEIAALIKKIHSYKPRIIGLDIVRDIPVEPGYKELCKVFKENKDIIGIEKVLPENSFPPPPDLPTEQVGFVDIIPDQDGQYRRYLLWIPDLDRKDVQKDKFSLSLRLATAYLSAEHITLEDIGNSDAIRFGSTEIPIFDSYTGGYIGTDDGGIQMLINFRNGKERFPVFSLHDIKTKIPENILRDKLRDKVVLIGMTATNSDLFDTSAISGLKLNGNIYGVEYHAHATSQIINAVIHGRPLLKTWSDTWEYLWIIVWGFIPIVIGRLAQSVWKNLLAVAASIICLIGVSYLLLTWWGWWIPVAPSLLILVINGVGLSAFAFYRHDQALKSQIHERTRTIEYTFTIIHNGPLQTLANALSSLRTQESPPEKLILQLEKLNHQIRDIGDFLKQEALNKEEFLRLGSGLVLDLKKQLNGLFYEVYSSTLQREDLKYLSAIKAKTRRFEPIDDKYLNIEYKRELCQFLEESLCNIGKHAKGAKSIEATGKNHDGCYTLSVKDDGCGTILSKKSNGTKQCENLAKKLGGKFKRKPISPRGCLCEISWSLVDRKSFIQKMRFQLKNRIKKLFSLN